jgi:isoaspartyl peptidase/L-asparaginase-like protein (Ntn-hydrolase superfamily)
VRAFPDVLEADRTAWRVLADGGRAVDAVEARVGLLHRTQSFLQEPNDE